ncbi:MAG: PorP/SprF family type IX secretion system membrane protein [Cyclobacteriaceae bacterium]|nr:PorP/SprF family type IX secretion system membrane protein [Cyclobacteriaceae bacterium]
MRKLLLLLLAFASPALVVEGQDIPLFSQKLTNAFIYNPAMAGHSFGSATASYRSNYANVAGAPENKFISIQSPFLDGRFGAGASLFQEDVNVMRNSYVSAAFAYHLPLGRFNRLSMGLGAEYNSLQLNPNMLSTLTDASDEVIQRYSSTTGKPDFSFGLMFENQFVLAGVSANRLSTAWFQDENLRSLSNYYTVFVQGKLPLRGGQDVLEPYFAFRKFSETNKTIDLGLFYTFNSKIIVGGAMRNGSVLNATAGFYVTKNLLLGYSREMILGDMNGFVGSSSEFTLRLDFNKKEPKGKFNSDYKSALSYRRKTLNTSGVGGKGGRSPKQLAKAQKRVAAYSPNKRYQNTAKLSGGRKSSMNKPKSKFKNKRRRPKHFR